MRRRSSGRLGAAGATLAVLLVGAASTAACGRAQETSGTTAIPSHQASGAERSAIEQAFFGYYRALVNRDFRAACALRTPETYDVLLRDAKAKDPAATGCEQGLAVLLSAPNAGELAIGITTTAKVSDVQLRGDEAVLSWSGQVAKANRVSADRLRRDADTWKVATPD